MTFNSFVPTAAFRATFVAATQPVVDLLPLPNGPSRPPTPGSRPTRKVFRIC